MTSDIIKGAEKKMQGAIDFAKEDFSGVRTGRANPAMFEKLEAEYYGVPTPIQQLASFSSPDPRTMLITPYDKGALGAIEKAVRDSDLGVNPASDGNAIRAVLPELTEERRKEYIKIVRAKAEDAKIAIRGHRRKGMDAIKAQEKDKEIGEDDARVWEKQLDGITKKYTEMVDELLKAKEAELLAV